MPGGFTAGTFFGSAAGGASAGAFPVATATGSGAFAFAGSTALGVKGKTAPPVFGGPAFAQSGLAAINCSSMPGSAPGIGVGGTGGSLGVYGTGCQEP